MCSGEGSAVPEKPNSDSYLTDIFTYPGADVYMSCKTTDRSNIEWSRESGVAMPASSSTASGPGWARLL